MASRKMRGKDAPGICCFGKREMDSTLRQFDNLYIQKHGGFLYVNVPEPKCPKTDIGGLPMHIMQ
jgi:hypothetical protein